MQLFWRKLTNKCNWNFNHIFYYYMQIPDDNEIRKGKVKGQYLKEVRSFAITLHFYSQFLKHFLREHLNEF